MIGFARVQARRYSRWLERRLLKQETATAREVARLWRLESAGIASAKELKELESARIRLKNLGSRLRLIRLSRPTDLVRHS